MRSSLRFYGAICLTHVSVLKFFDVDHFGHPPRLCFSDPFSPSAFSAVLRAYCSALFRRAYGYGTTSRGTTFGDP